MFAEIGGLVLCPVCRRMVSKLSKNGICQDCPEYRKFLKSIGYKNAAKIAVVGGVSQFNRSAGRGAIIQKPAGRSGKIETYIDKEYVDNRFKMKAGSARARGKPSTNT